MIWPKLPVSNIPCFTNVKCFHFLPVKIFSFSPFHLIVFQSKLRKWEDPHLTIYVVQLCSMIFYMNPRASKVFWSLSFYNLSGREKVVGHSPALAKWSFHFWVLLTPEKRLHCLSPISYIVLNKLKIIWQKELSIWRSDSWKCWNTHLALKEPQISHKQ